MLRDQNPGLARRFPVAQAFVFDDYTDEELLTIFKKACAEKNYKLESYKVWNRSFCYIIVNCDPDLMPQVVPS